MGLITNKAQKIIIMFVDENHKSHQRYNKDMSLYQKSYLGMSFTPIDFPDGPGSPRRFFSRSFRAEFPTEDDDDSHLRPNNQTAKSHRVIQEQIVHTHVNGLCIVTAGEFISREMRDNPNLKITNVKYLKETTSVTSVGGKRKKKARMMNNKNAKFNKNEDGITSAVDTLAEVSLSDGRVLSFKSCVSGIVLETNPRFQNHSGHQALGDTNEYPNMKENIESTTHPKVESAFSLLATDPIFNGYLAIIMPNGSFPPIMTSLK